MSTKNVTHTIQTWPGGASFEYRGDPDGPAGQRKLRAGHYQARIRCGEHCSRFYLAEGGDDNDPRLGKYCRDIDGAPAGSGPEICQTCNGEGYVKNPESNHWRHGTAEEWKQIRASIRAELYARNYIKGCASALVDDLVKAANSGHLPRDLEQAFSYDEIRNIYKDPSDWGVEECRDYINDRGDEDDVSAPNPWKMDRAALVETLEEVGIECRDDESDETLREAVISNMDDETIEGLDAWRDHARELAQDDPAEVYEWWAVDSWLCEQLHAIGEVTIDNGYGQWWGRCCTGQGLIMDGTLQRIAARYERAA